MLVWGLIAQQKAWHVYTHKAAKHDGGILTARPVCGGAPFSRGGSTASMQTVSQIEPVNVMSPFVICETCRTKWLKNKKKGRCR